MIVDIEMFVVRMVTFFLVLTLLMLLFAGLSDLSDWNELTRNMNELGENMIGSGFTIEHSVFDPLKYPAPGSGNLYDIHNSLIEPLRFCRIPATFEFLTRKDGKEVPKFKFGYDVFDESSLFSTQFSKHDLESMTRDWNIMIKDDEQMIPGIMRVTLWVTPFAHDPTTGRIRGLRAKWQSDVIDIGCAVENAYRYKREEVAEFYCSNLVGCTVYATDKKMCYKDSYGAESECRYIGIDIIMDEVEVGSSTTKMRVIPVTDAAADCAGIGFDNKDAEHPQSILKNQNEPIAKVVLCPIREGVQGERA